MTAQRKATPRPIEDWERPFLAAVGARLRAARLHVGLSQFDVAGCVGLDRSYLSRLENGHRRPRESTLRRLVAELNEAAPADVPDVDALVAELVALAGPTLAPESPRQSRIDRRRDRRGRRFLKNLESGLSLEESWWYSARRGGWRY